MRKKIVSEAETRKTYLSIGQELGIREDVARILAKYDNLLARCTNPMEREAISLAGNEELHFLLSSRPGFIMVGDKKIGRE